MSDPIVIYQPPTTTHRVVASAKVGPPGPAGVGSSSLVARLGSGNHLRIAYKNDAATDLIIDMGPYNVNQLLGFNAISTAPNTGTDPSLDLDRTLTPIQTLSTDYVGPYQVQASAGGDGGAEVWTGGGHNSLGIASSSGTPTARMLSMAVYLDGTPLPADGLARQGARLDITVVNRVQGFNTLVSHREILEETTHYTITESGVEVHNEITALEALTITRYYGMQASNAGMDTVYWPGGVVGRTSLAADSNCGTKDTAPNVSRFSLHGTGGVNLVGWIDRAYGIGTMDGLFHTLWPSFVDSIAAKTYFYLIRDTGLALAAGESCRWRGGWYFGPNLGVAGADSAYVLVSGGKRQYVVDFLAASGGSYLPVKPEEKNQPVTLLGSYGSPALGTRSTSKGVWVSAPGNASLVLQIGDNPLLVTPPNGDITVTPANPIGTSSGIAMMGLGVIFTPKISSRAMVIISGQTYNATSGYGTIMSLRYGTGAAPANGAAPTGTQVGASATKNFGFADYSDSFVLQGVLKDLVPGKPYWVDMTLAQQGGGTAWVNSLTVTVVEI